MIFKNITFTFSRYVIDALIPKSSAYQQGCIKNNIYIYFAFVSAHTQNSVLNDVNVVVKNSLCTSLARIQSKVFGFGFVFAQVGI